MSSDTRRVREEPAPTETATRTPAPRIAFYAPMKPPTHPTPSGDREIARLTLRALAAAGFDPFLASDLRVLDMAGDARSQEDLAAAANTEARRLITAFTPRPPAAWVTYHCYYKAPDLIGPTVAHALNIPYVISEPSISPKRRDGPWAGFAAASEHAIAAADRLLWSTERDQPALEAAGHAARMTHLPPFLDMPEDLPSRIYDTSKPLKLLTIAMMRPGDKLESYRRLARAIAHLNIDWTLEIIGDGPARAEVKDLFAMHADRITFRGRIDDPETLGTTYRTADIFLWPGVGEGVGMVWLEAQAAGLPVIAEDHPAARDIVANRLAPPANPAAFSALVAETAADLLTHSATARAHIESRHSLDAAAAILRQTLGGLIR